MMKGLVSLTLGCALVLVLMVAFRASKDSTRADEQGWPTPVAATIDRSATLPVSRDASNPVRMVASLSREQAIEIARGVAAGKGDPHAQLVAVDQMKLGDALRELAPGMQLAGVDPGEAVFVVRLRGGPFQHVRSVPLNRNPADFMTNGVFVVIRVSDREVVGTGALHYPE